MQKKVLSRLTPSSVGPERSTLSGMILEFKGTATGKDISGISSASAKKTFPKNVFYVLVEGWNTNKFDAVDPVLKSFLESKGLLQTYSEMTGLIKTKCKGITGYSGKKVGEVVYGKYAPDFEAKGVQVSPAPSGKECRSGSVWPRGRVGHEGGLTTREGWPRGRVGHEGLQLTLAWPCAAADAQQDYSQPWHARLP